MMSEEKTQTSTGLVVTRLDDDIYLIQRYFNGKPEIIGKANSLSLTGIRRPEYDEKAQHVLLQKLISSDGTKSLLYMLPIENELNEVCGAFLFKKTKQDDHLDVRFLGSVGLRTYKEMLKEQIPEADALKYPFVSESTTTFEPDTVSGIQYHHYAPQPASQHNVVSKFIASHHKHLPDVMHVRDGKTL